MDLTKEEILYANCGDEQVQDGKSLYYMGNQEENIYIAMEQFSKQQAISFANWLAYNQTFERETIEQLYKRYSEA